MHVPAYTVTQPVLVDAAVIRRTAWQKESETNRTSATGS
jgi:hypothetical protein